MNKAIFSNKTILYLAIAFILGMFAGFAGERVAYSRQQSALLSSNNTDTTTCARENGAYQYTNPLLLCNSPESTASSQYSLLKNKVSAFIKQQSGQALSQSGDQESVSVYYQDLDSGNWFGINEDDQYSPASLLKVPIMIAYYKQSQNDSALLNSTLTYTGVTDSNAGETFKSIYDIMPGTYSVDNLIKAMIVNSDNNALDLLAQGIDQSTLNQLYTYLGVPINETGTVDFMTAKSYAQFFRVLYNATYLSKNNSETALELLASADFPQGLRAGTGSSSLPTSVPIAQKFGERSDVYLDGVVQERDLHDCGIIYVPGDPYLLCVMTKVVIGNTEQSGPATATADFQNLSETIQGISKIVYGQVSRNAT